MPSISKFRPAVDDTRKSISNSVMNTGRWIDSFFTNETYEEERNRSSLRLRTDVVFENDERPSYNISPDLRLVLPHTEDKLLLELTSDADEDFELFTDAPEGATMAERISRRAREAPTASLRYFFTATALLNISMTAGVRFDDVKPVFFMGPRYRKTRAFDPWAVEFIQSLRYFTDDRWVSDTRFDINRAIGEQFLFRSSIDGKWVERTSQFSYNLDLQLFQRWSSRVVLKYEWNNRFSTQPHHQLDEINFQFKYRRQLLQPWLFGELSPLLSFPRENDFDVTPGFLFRIEMYFGARYINP